MQEVNEILIEISEPQTAVLASRQSLILDMAGQGGGKSQNIGYSSGMFISDFPQALGFIGANTAMQLSQSTLVRVFKVWKDVYGLSEYDAKKNPAGSYVVDKRPPLHFERIHHLRDYSGTISFWNGSLIFIGSLENYQAHDGKEFAWAHLDETKDTKEAALKEVIIGRLRQYGLWFDTNTGDVYFLPDLKPDKAKELNLKAWNPLYIHTSPALGGVKWLNEMFKLGKFEKDIKTEVLKEERGFFHKEFENKAVIIYSTHHNAENLPPNYIENQIANLQTEDAILKLVFGYPFGKSGGEYYPAFRRSKHVGKVDFIHGLPVHLTWDFNGVPYMTCLASQIRYYTRYLDPVGNKHDMPAPGYVPIEVMQIRYYKEYCFGKFGQPGTAERNTIEEICRDFSEQHDPLTTEVYYYGDAQGLNRIEGLGSLTRFKVMEDNLQVFLHNHSKRVKAPNVGNSTRRELLNKIFAGRIPEVEIIIDEEMEFTITDFEHVKEGVNGKIKPKVEDKDTGGRYEALGHCTDAAEYEVADVAKEFIRVAA